ncbi:hypothetical protein BDV41DRAFT_573721 [Aspergillus transmontanensis]|uniref:Uncharacterized protein n=1 Tax=Aspergillus transmontanensis TaxID=1034304 RepID=A0A5N6W6G8_9EURO|nr:hypothetical protein BDV41DRAFT_573721 [Aspergillus transmontanensis]
MKPVATPSPGLPDEVDKYSVPLSSDKNGTTQAETPLDNVIDVESVRSHFPVLEGEMAAFNNASGTVVLKEAIESWYKVFGPHMGTLYASRKAQDRYMTSISHIVSSSSPDGKLALGMPSFELQLVCSPIVSFLQDTVGWDRIVRQETVLVTILLEYLLSEPSVYRLSIVTFEVVGRSSGDVVMRVNTRNRFGITLGICLAPRPRWDVLKPVSGDGLIRLSFVTRDS